MNAKLILVAMAITFACISAKPRAPLNDKEYSEYIARRNDRTGPWMNLGQLTKRASCHCSDDQGGDFDTQWHTGTEFWVVTCASQGWKDCNSRYGAMTNCCREK